VSLYPIKRRKNEMNLQMDGIKGKRSEFTADLIFLVAYEKESFW
jgi:hypothetical protein